MELEGGRLLTDSLVPHSNSQQLEAELEEVKEEEEQERCRWPRTADVTTRISV